MKLTVFTYNTLFAGRDGADERRARAQAGLINELCPDVFLMQEAKGFEANGGAWLYALEQHIGLRGFLAVQAAPDKLTLVTGDFNSASPHDPEPRDWAALAPHHRARYLAEDLQGIDRSVLSSLEAAGWVDLIVGLGIAFMNADAAKAVWTAAREEHAQA